MPRRATIDQITSEADIERTITEWLALDGWIGLKTNPVSNRARGAGFGEVGMADYQYRRFQDVPGTLPSTILWRAQCELFWIEFKQPKGVHGRHQIAWQDREKARGALVLALGQDVAPTIEAVQDWYRRSGLMRRKI